MVPAARGRPSKSRPQSGHGLRAMRRPGDRASPRFRTGVQIESGRRRERDFGRYDGASPSAAPRLRNAPAAAIGHPGEDGVRAHLARVTGPALLQRHRDAGTFRDDGVVGDRRYGAARRCAAGCARHRRSRSRRRSRRARRCPRPGTAPRAGSGRRSCRRSRSRLRRRGLRVGSGRRARWDARPRREPAFGLAKTLCRMTVMLRPAGIPGSSGRAS